MHGEYPPARRRSARRTRGRRAGVGADAFDPNVIGSGRGGDLDTDGFGAGGRDSGADPLTEPGAAGTGDDSVPSQPAWSDEWTARDTEEHARERRTGRRGKGRENRRGSRREESAETAETAEPADPESLARQICLNQLSYAPKTRSQLRGALIKREIPEDIADAVLGRFADVGLIDDAAFAKAWVESRHYSKGLSSRALKSELRQRGVGNEDIDDAVATLDPDAETEAARRLVDRKLSSTRGLPTQTRTRRLAGMLARKGYPAGLAFRVIREALEAEGVAGEETEAVLDDDPPSDWS